VVHRYIFIPKIPIRICFGGPWNGKCGPFITIRWFLVIWYIFPTFWYIVSRKIWQPWCPMWLKVPLVNNLDKQKGLNSDSDIWLPARVLNYSEKINFEIHLFIFLNWKSVTQKKENSCTNKICTYSDLKQKFCISPREGDAKTIFSISIMHYTYRRRIHIHIGSKCQCISR
jgi:hypothetical protein